MRFFFHLGMDRFYHHNRVIDDNTDRQYKRKKGDEVNRKAECLDHKECTHQRYRHREDRDQCRTPVAQEDEHNDGYQDKCVTQSVDHLLDRSVEERRNVITDLVIHAGRKGSLHYIQLRFYFFNYIACVTAVVLAQYDRRGGLAVQVGIDIEELTTQLYFGNVLQMNAFPLGIGANDNVLI